MPQTFFSVFIVDFEQVNVSWATLFLQKLKKNLCEPNIHEVNLIFIFFILFSTC